MTQFIINSGQSSSVVVGSGDTLTVEKGGTSSSSTIASGGQELVSGSSISDAVAGSQTVVAGGQAYATQVTSGGYVDVLAGGGTFGDDVAGGSETVENGATIYNVVLNGGSLLVVGTVSGGTISAGDVTFQGGPYQGQFSSASGLTVLSGATISLPHSEFYLTETILSGVTLAVSGFDPMSLSEADGTQVFAGAQLLLGEFGTTSNTVIYSGGLESVGVGGNTTNPVISGGTLELGYGSDQYNSLNPPKTQQAYGPITFSGSGGALIVHGTTAPNSVISGFNTTDRILFPNVAADPAATLAVSGDTVTLSAGGAKYVLDIVGASSLGLTLGIGTTSGNVDIGVACYCAGTSILTAEGETPVESIAPGDHVITADGRSEPVVWVGHRSYAGRFLRRQPHLLPVRIRAGALGQGLPRRDLLMSPNHALLLDGVLVPAEALTGLPGIAVEHGCEQVEYYHLELARHDVILAEGAPAETFLDDESRGIFQASQGTPGEATVFCAPRRADGFALEAIRRRLAA